jgi:hypothetical protein
MPVCTKRDLIKPGFNRLTSEIPNNKIPKNKIPKNKIPKNIIPNNKIPKQENAVHSLDYYFYSLRKDLLLVIIAFNSQGIY